MATRKQLQWDDSTDIWPITDASAVHYTYNPSDSSKILNPVSGTSYGLDNFLNGLLDRVLTQDLIVAAATNVNKGKGILYNTGSSITDVALPSAGTSNLMLACTYTSAGVLSLSFLGTSNISINGSNYALYTTSGTLPTILAPTAYASTGGLVLATNSAMNALEWVSLPTKSSWNYDDTYVKLNSGTEEQTVTCSITSATKGIVEFYRASGNHKSLIGFSNKTSGGTKQFLGFLGFDKDGSLIVRPSDTDYYIYHTGNLDLSNYLNMTTSRTANTFLAAPNGSDGAPTFRSLVSADIPDLAALYVDHHIISAKTTTGTSYTIFARVSSSSTSRYKDCMLLISGGGYYYSGGFTGQWILEMRSSTGGTPSIQVYCLMPPVTTTTITFGYYTADSVTYFGIKSSSRRGQMKVTRLFNSSSLFSFNSDVLTTAPTGWTEVSYKTMATTNLLGSYLPLSGGTMTGNIIPVSSTATAIISLDVTKTFIYATISANATLGTSAAMAVGLCLTVLVYNSGSASITITVPSSFQSGSTVNSLDGTSLVCGAEKFMEISILCYASAKYMISAKLQ